MGMAGYEMFGSEGLAPLIGCLFPRWAGGLPVLLSAYGVAGLARHCGDCVLTFCSSAPTVLRRLLACFWLISSFRVPSDVTLKNICRFRDPRPLGLCGRLQYEVHEEYGV